MTVILASSNSRSLFTDLLQGTGRLEVILDRSISASAVYNSSNRRGVVPSFYSHLLEILLLTLCLAATIQAKAQSVVVST